MSAARARSLPPTAPALVRAWKVSGANRGTKAWEATTKRPCPLPVAERRGVAQERAHQNETLRGVTTKLWPGGPSINLLSDGPAAGPLPPLRALREASRPTALELSLRPARAALGGRKPAAWLTQDELATRAGRHRNAVALWERGAKVPSLATRAALVAALGVEATVEQLQAWSVGQP